MGDEDFDVPGVTCRPMAGFNVKLGMNWPKTLQFCVRLKTGEDHEAAARRWLATERGQRHRAKGTRPQESTPCDPGEAEEQTERCDSLLEPDTMDADMEEVSAGERRGSPLRLGCFACEEDDCVAAVYLAGGRFCCEDGVDDPVNEAFVRQAAEEQLAAREAAAAQQPPVLPSPELRRSPREVKSVSRLEPEWSAYTVGRTGQRHVRTRDESYAEMQAAREKQRADVAAAALENADLAANLDGVFERLRELAAPGALGEAGLQDDC
jgi:hypothetical protein